MAKIISEKDIVTKLGFIKTFREVTACNLKIAKHLADLVEQREVFSGKPGSPSTIVAFADCFALYGELRKTYTQGQIGDAVETLVLIGSMSQQASDCMQIVKSVLNT